MRSKKKEGERERESGGRERANESTVIVGKVTRIEMRRSGLVLTADLRNKQCVIESCSVYKN